MVNILGDDCRKCQFLFEELFAKTKIPKFLIFPEGYREDSVTISQMYSRYEDVQIVYSDSYFEKINIGSSGISYLSYEAEVMYSKSIMHVETEDILKIDSMYQSDFLRKSSLGYEEFMYGDWWVRKNYSTGTIILDSLSSFSQQWSLDSNIITKAFEAIEENDPNFYDLTLQNLSKGLITQNYLRPSIKGYQFFNNHLYYTIGIPFAVPSTEEEIAMGFPDGSLTEKYVLVQEDVRKKSRLFFPIYPDFKDLEHGYTTWLFPNSFHLVSNSEILFMDVPEKPADQEKHREFLAIYQIADGKVIPKKKLNNLYPKMLIAKGLNFRLQPKFDALDYPYYAHSYTNIITNLENGQDVEFQSENPKIDFARIDPTFLDKLLSRNDQLPIDNQYLSVLERAVYLFSKIDSEHFLYVFERGGGDELKLDQVIKLEDKGLKLHKYPKYYVDKNKHLLYYHDEQRKMRSVPLQFVLG